MRDWSLFARFVLPLAWATLVTNPAPALAQHNASRIVIPESGVQSSYGQARPYPSTIDVDWTTGAQVESVSVVLHHVTHSCLQDLDILLVAPDNTSIVLMSDVGGCPGVESTRTLTFSDLGFPAAVDSVPGDGSTLAPTDAVGGWADSYPFPAPTGPFAANMAAFKGKSAHGWWRLFVVDDSTGNRGEILAWTLVLKVVHHFSTTAQIELPPGGGSNVGAGFPYPSTVVSHGVTGRIDRVRPWVQLRHEDPDDVDLLLKGPDGQQTLLMSDAGGYGDVPFPGVILTFDDAAVASLPDSGPLAEGTYRPTDHAPADTFGAPAPSGPYPASLSVFKNTAPNLTWSLFAVDDATAGAGLIAQWGLRIVTVRSAAVPTLDLIGPQTITADGPFQAVSVKVGDATDALVTWRNAANGATGLARSAGGTYDTALVPVVAGSNGVTLTLTNAAGEQVSRFVTIQASSFTYTFSEGATGPFFDLDVSVFNPNQASAPFTLQFLTPSGPLGPKPYVLGSRSRLRIPVESLAGEFPGLASTAASVVVTSTAALPLAAERAMFWDATRYGGHAGSAVTSPSTFWLFAEGAQGFFDTFVLLSNANATPSNVSILFLKESGPPVSRAYSIPAHTRFNVWTATIPELLNQSFGIEVTSDLPITAERAMYFSGSSPRLFEGGHESPGVTQMADEWFFAEGATGPFFDTYILVTNLSMASQPIHFTYRTGAGTVVNKVRMVGPVSRLTVNIEHEDPLLADTAVSTTVSAPVPIVAERAMYWPGDAPTWHGAHNSFGLVDTGSRWGVADGRVGGPEGFETYILIVNPEPVDAMLTMTFSRLGLSSPVVKYALVPANSRLNVTLATHAPEVLDPSGATEFSATIEATNLTRIAVERATYWNSGGTTWAGGANVPATRLR